MSKVGAALDTPSFYQELTARENIECFAHLYENIPNGQVMELLDYVGLKNQAEKKVKKFSLGMKQKIGIIQAIMEEPDVLVLDEPFNALDQEAVKLLRELLLNFQNKGKLVVITSHHKDDIESVCNKIIRIDRGQIV